jgi:Protein of unknown function (DUF4079)
MDIQIPDSLKPFVTFFHPVMMALTLMLALYALYLGIQSRRSRSATGSDKKAMMEAKYGNRHFQVGSIFLVLMVLGSVGGMTVTFINNQKLFVGPHLIAGLGLASLAAVSAALAPLMQQGKEWARITHITINVTLVGIFAWQTATGFEIVLKILDQMSKGT